MSVYFEKKLNIGLGNACSIVSWWEDKFLAAGCISSDEGSFITIFDNQGAVIKKLENHGEEGVISALAWHPRGSLAASWKNSLFSWNPDDSEANPAESPHRSSITLLLFSTHGGRLISIDSNGGLVGWNSTNRQLVTVFHHQLTDPVTHAVFRNPTKGVDVRDVAKAAVAGDEKALDLFTNLDMFSWRPKTAGRRPIIYHHDLQDGMSFYATTQTGIIFYVSENGRCEEMFNLSGYCQDLLYQSEKDRLVVLTEALAVYVFVINHEGALNEHLKVKLSGDPRDISPRLCCTSSDTIAINTGGVSLRLWDMDQGDNVVLTLPDSAPSAERFSDLAYCSVTGTLCGGTNAGNLFFWSKNSDGDWVVRNEARIGSPVRYLAWGQELLAVSTLSNLYLLKQHSLSAAFFQNYGCVQTTGNIVSLLFLNEDRVIKQEIVSEIQVQGLAISAKYCLLFSDKTAAVFKFTLEKSDSITVQSLASFQCECEDVAIFEESLIILELKRVTVRTIQGVVKQILFLVPTDGDPIVLGLLGCFVSVVTGMGIVRLWDLSRREAKSHGKGKDLKTIINRFGEVISILSNCDGSKIAFTLALDNLVPDNNLYVMNLETDTIAVLDISKDFRNFSIVKFTWDEEDPKLMSVYIRAAPENCLLFLWIADSKILIHEKIRLTKSQIGLLYLKAPWAICLSSLPGTFLERVSMGDFLGVSDLPNKTAILNFSFNLAIGNMDAAFKAINSVSCEKVWMNLAKNCVKSKRLDVAQVCMGRIKNARIAKALRLAQREPELEARVALLAIQVNMLDEAADLLKSCQRYDLLNKLYQTMSEWEMAIEVAEKWDRMHLRNTHHLYGEFLEQTGQFEKALEHFEKADTHRIHGPMLLLNEPQKLKAYVDKSSDPPILKWMAQNLEATGDMQNALEYYRKAGDFCSIIRIFCFLNEFDEAKGIVESSSDKAAAYHLARQFEALNRIEEALEFFVKAGAFGNAVRICKENGLTDKVWLYALQGAQRDQLDAATYLLDMGETHKACLLFDKAGFTPKALEIAFANDDYGALEIISRDFSSKMEPGLVDKLANFFVSRQQFQRAVDIFAAAQKFSDAVALCKHHAVEITENLAEKLSPVGENSKELLIEIADCALRQGNYHLAAKKFTQAGDKIQAMKALLKSGDTDKIIFLAGVCRDREVYVMAGNYLQALDWRSDQHLLNTIIQFYTKAKAYQALANFYLACASTEVDEYEDYDKAIAALQEAKRCFAKVSEDGMSRRATESVEKRIENIQEFLRVRQTFEKSMKEGFALAYKLMGQIDDNGPISKGHLYGLMIRNETDRPKLRQLYEEMRQNVADPMRYLPASAVQILGLKATDNESVEHEEDYEIREVL